MRIKRYQGHLQRVYSIILLCSLVTLAGRAQVTQPVKGDNIIEITTNQPDSVLYKLVGRALIDAGYTFKADKEFGTFKTDEKPLHKQPAFQLTNNISLRQGTIKMTGILRNIVVMHLGGASAASPGFPLDYRNGNMTMHRAGFLQMIELATVIQQTIPEATITYRKQ